MMSIAWQVFRKELIDHLRDRRSMLTVLLSSVLMGPLVLLLFSQFISGLEEKSARREVVVAGGEHAPVFLNFLARQAYTVKTPPADYESRLRSGTLTSAVIVIPPDFQQKYERAEPVELRLVYDATHAETEASVRAAGRLVQAFNSEQGVLRLIARGVSPALLAPLTAEEVNLAASQARGAQLLFLVPMFSLIACLIGAHSVAIDVTAGERERGSLEPLLLNPVNTKALVLGKWGVVTLVAAMVVGLTLGGLMVAMKLVGNETLAALFQFGTREVSLFAGLLLPFAGLAGAVLMLVAAFGRSHKEAQAYAGYLLMAVNLVPLFTLFSGAKEAPWQLFVPALAQQMAMVRATRGAGLDAVDLLVPAAVSAAGAAACLLLLSRLLRDERVVYGRSG